MLKYDYFSNVGTVARWLVCLTALALACLSLAISVGVGKDGLRRDRILCVASGHTTVAVNDAHTSIRDLITRQRDNALARVGTSKELPTDKETVRYFTQFLSTIHTTVPLNCKVLD